MSNITDAILAGLQAGLGPTAALYALAALGLNLHFGYTGLLNFGQVGFMLTGAYGMAVSVAIWGWPFWGGVLFGLFLSVILALLLGIPTLRLRADYLAITTIAAAEILRFVVRSQPATSVTAGVFGIPSQFSIPEGATTPRNFGTTFYSINPIPEGQYGFGALSYDERRLWTLLVGWILVVLVTLLLRQLMRSPWGRVIRAIREDEDAAAALGKNVFAHKMQSLVLGGLMGALAGQVLVLAQNSITPDIFLPQLTFFAYAILILGGAASTWGPIAGSIIFWFLVTAIDSYLRSGDSLSTDVLGATRLALVGLGLMLLMIFRPQGIFGNKQEMMLDA